MLFKQLKIKDNVDLAGLSPLLLPLNHINISKLELSEISQNNNLFHVILLLEMPDVTEVWNITVCNIMLKTESAPNHLIHTPLEMVEVHHANNLLVLKTLSLTPDIHRLKEPVPLKTLATFNQHLLPLMLKTGLHIPVEFSATVEHLLIMPSYLLDILAAIG